VYKRSEIPGHITYMNKTQEGERITPNGADTTESSKNSFDDVVPDSKRIVNVLLGQIQANVGRVILPFLRLFWVPDTETEPPGNTHNGVGKEVGRGKWVELPFGRLDLRHDGSEVGRLPSNDTAVLLLYGVAATKDDGLSAFQFVHGYLVQLGQQYCSGEPQGERKRLTENREQEEAQRPLLTMATFVGSNNASAGGSKEKG